MKNYFYFNTIRKTTIQLLDNFNDVRIARFDKNGNIRKMINVPLKFAPKAKEYSWLYNKHNQLYLPQMALEYTGIEFDSSRQTNKNANITLSTTPSAGVIRKVLNPIPYNIEYELNIYVKNMDDINQIVEQILPYFNSNNWIRLQIPEIGAKLDLKVLYNGSSMDMATELPGDTIRILKWDMTFTVQAWLFKPLEITPLIKKIIENYYTTEEAFDDTDMTTTPFVSGGGDPVKQGNDAWSTADITKFTEGLNLSQTGEIEYLVKRYGI